MGATNGAETAYPSGTPEFTLVISGVCIARSLVFYAVVCRLLFILLSLYRNGLSFSDLRLQITPLVSSKFSIKKIRLYKLYSYIGFIIVCHLHKQHNFFLYQITVTYSLFIVHLFSTLVTNMIYISYGVRVS